jgi:hypothetical protein
MAATSIVNTEIEKVRTKVPILYDYDDAFYTKIEKKNVDVISERDMRIPLDMAPGGYFGFYNPGGGDLGIGNTPDWDKAVINTVHMKFATQWDAKSQWGSDTNTKAVVNLFKELMAKAMPEFRRQSDNQCHTDGTGVLATITTPTTSAGVDTYVCTTDGYGVRLLRKGQRINVYDATLATQRTPNPVTITYYDINANTIKVTPAVTGVVATDVIVPEGLNGANPVGLFGIPYNNSSSSSGTWLGFTRSTTPEIRSNSVDAGGAALALPYPRLAINKVGNRVGIKKRDKFVAMLHPCQTRAYENLGQLVSIIQKTASDENLDMYFNSNMRMAGAPIEEDYSWDKKRIDFLKLDSWGRAELHPAGFYKDASGRMFFPMRGPSGGIATSNIFYIVASWNLYTDNPAAQSYIYNLQVPTGYIT